LEVLELQESVRKLTKDAKLDQQKMKMSEMGKEKAETDLTELTIELWKYKKYYIYYQMQREHNELPELFTLKEQKEN